MDAHLKRLELEEKFQMVRTLQEKGWRDIGEGRWRLQASALTVIEMQLSDAYDYATKYQHFEEN